MALRDLKALWVRKALSVKRVFKALLDCPDLLVLKVLQALVEKQALRVLRVPKVLKVK